MKPRPDPPPGPYLVVGLARSGVAAARLLRGRGEDVAGVDAGRPEVDLGDMPVQLETDGIGLLERARAVVKSPGVPSEAPVIAAARSAGLPVLGEVELAWRYLANEFIAVTGTNGKTTTAEWIGHIHRTAGLPVAVAGNVGTPLSALVGTVAADATIVCEASSFQLEDAQAFAPEAAVLLNIEPDHLDRHGTFAAYRDAKLRVFAHQGNDDVAVAPSGLGVDDLGGCARRVCFGSAPDSELALRAGQLFWADEPLLRAEELPLPGAHNVHNAMAAAAVTLARGVDPDAVREGLRTFAGVEHRLETVGERDGVRWVNDSKATNVASTLVALAAFAGSPVHLILGGQGKGQTFTALREPAAGCAQVLLIGSDGERIGAAIGTGEYVETLDRAVAAARAAARLGAVVLLSPACASFDQFADFEERGRTFKRLVVGGS